MVAETIVLGTPMPCAATLKYRGRTGDFCDGSLQAGLASLLSSTKMSIGENRGKTMKARRVAAFLGTCALFGGLATIAGAQQTQQTSQSVADAARKAKEQQKQGAKTKVWTNDNIPTSATVSVVGQAPQAGNAANQETAAAPAGPETPEELTTERDNTTADLAQAQKDLASAKTDLDIAQREEKLDSDQFYGTPNYAGDQQGQAKLAADKSQVTAKQQAVDAAQKKVDDLQKQLDDLNGKLKSPADSNQPKN
jgi:hypothetical protein